MNHTEMHKHIYIYLKLLRSINKRLKLDKLITPSLLSANAWVYYQSEGVPSQDISPLDKENI